MGRGKPAYKSCIKNQKGKKKNKKKKELMNYNGKKSSDDALVDSVIIGFLLINVGTREKDEKSFILYQYRKIVTKFKEKKSTEMK